MLFSQISPLSNGLLNGQISYIWKRIFLCIECHKREREIEKSNVNKKILRVLEVLEDPANRFMAFERRRL